MKSGASSSRYGYCSITHNTRVKELSISCLIFGFTDGDSIKSPEVIEVIHGDIKLDNIMVADRKAKSLRVKLIDFGSAFPSSKAKQGDIHQTTHCR